MDSIHTPVLLHEVVDALTKAPAVSEEAKASAKSSAKSDVPVYVDGTLGGAGHALAIAEALKGKVRIVGLDRDEQAIARAAKKLAGSARDIIIENANYRDLDAVLDRHGIAQAHMILLDLGISSDELENSNRGFSFQNDEPLFMTMGDPDKAPFTAKSIVNEWKEEDIANVIFGYGEERYARRIAKAIVTYREKAPIQTSHELAEIVKMAVPFGGRRPGGRPAKIHPATKTFQALRIAVNDELEALKEGLGKAYARLAPGGRIAVISFHSLEDRIVKVFCQAASKEGATILTKKPMTAQPEEIAENPRSRSAKLRILQKN